MRKLPAWLRSHPIISILLAVVLLFTAMHFFLNWQSERRWQAYVKEGRARGVKFDLAEFAPPKIPDEENFAALPMMRAIFKPGAMNPMALPTTNRPNFGDPLKGERLDWEKWQIYFQDAGFISETTDSPPRDVLRALGRYAPQFQEWSEWKTRTKCRFDLDFKEGAGTPLPHLGIFQNAVTLFSMRLRAHLALGDSAEAYSDFVEGFQAYRALTEEPAIITGLVRVSVLAILVAGIGEGLADHAWAESEIHKLDADLATVRVWEDYRLSMMSERGEANWLHETIIAASGRDRARFFLFGGLYSSPSPVDAALMACIPQRVFRDNQLRANQYFDEMLGAVNVEATRFDPDRPTPSSPENVSGFDRYYLYFFAASVSGYDFIARKFALSQTKLDQIHLAIAIERIRIKRGKIPETLTDLVPDFIAEVPQDIYTRQPMIYRRKETGGFLLYSVGPDRRDDGGTIDPNKSEVKQPDWVWPYSRD